MELGTGIFLSSLVLAGVFLFSITKDRWNWKNITKFTAIFAMSSLAIVTLIIYLQDITKSQKISFTTFKAPVKFAGVSLNESKSDVLFRLGKPEKTEIREGNEYLFYDSTRIKIENNLVTQVVFWGNKYNAPNIDGFNFYADLNELKSILGEPSDIQISKDQTRRIYNFKSNNIGVVMEKEEIISVAIFDGKKSSGLVFNEK